MQEQRHRRYFGHQEVQRHRRWWNHSQKYIKRNQNVETTEVWTCSRSQRSIQTKRKDISGVWVRRQKPTRSVGRETVRFGCIVRYLFVVRVHQKDHIPVSKVIGLLSQTQCNS